MPALPDPLANVTGLLLAWREGKEAALSGLIPVVERELHRIAQRCMAREHAGHSLQATGPTVMRDSRLAKAWLAREPSRGKRS